MTNPHYDESWPKVTVIGERDPLAAHPHNCTVCGRPIAIGSRYHRVVLRNHESLDRRKALVVAKYHLPYCPEESHDH